MRKLPKFGGIKGIIRRQITDELGLHDLITRTFVIFRNVRSALHGLNKLLQFRRKYNIIFGAVFIGGYSDAPVTGLNSAVTGKSLIPEEQNPVVSTADENSGRASEPPIPEGKSRSMGTYIPNWENWDGDWDWDDKALMEAYAACGIEKNGKFYYYCGETVYILKNQRPDSSIYLINTEGTVSIKVNWNAEGEITGVSYIAKEEVEKLKPKLLGTS